MRRGYVDELRRPRRLHHAQLVRRAERRHDEGMAVAAEQHARSPKIVLLNFTLVSARGRNISAFTIFGLNRTRLMRVEYLRPAPGTYGAIDDYSDRQVTVKGEPARLDPRSWAPSWKPGRPVMCLGSTKRGESIGR
jgi:hypothetical protein